MKTRTILGGLALAAALSAGVATTALAQSNPSTPPSTSSTPASTPAADPAAKGARKDFACSEQTQINDLLAQRKALLAARSTLEREARQAAVAAHADAWVVKIDNHIAETVKAQAKLAQRTQRFEDWAAKSCTG